MAERIRPARKGQRKNREEQYPWDQWFDGEQYRLLVGLPSKEDTRIFDIHAKCPKNATITVRKAVKRRGIKVSVQLDGPEHILVQAKLSRKPKRK